MNKIFKYVLSVMTVLAFVLLYLTTKDQVGVIALPVLVVALIGAIRIIWKMKPHKGIDVEDNDIKE